jgi:DNA repair protein RadC
MPELIAVCLGTISHADDAVGTARRMLEAFDGLEGLLAASPRELMLIRGLGRARAARLKAIRELSTRQSEERLKRPSRPFCNVAEAGRYVQRRIGHSPREVFGGLYLDSRHRLLAWETLALGSVDKAHVHAREVLRRGIELNAAAVILAHNHPSGVAEPSQSDLILTRNLSELLEKVDIRVLDHIIVSRHERVSLASRGFM